MSVKLIDLSMEVYKEMMTYPNVGDLPADTKPSAKLAAKKQADKRR